MFAGKWFNPHTGQEIFVRNTIETEQGMQIMTSIGAMTGEQFSQFVKSEESGDVTVTKSQPAPVPQMSADPDILAELESAKAINQSINQSINQQIIPAEAQVSKPTNSNQDILKKLFDKQETEPIIKVDIEWENFPKSQLDTFINVLDISKEDIAAYIIDNYLDTYHVIEAVSNFLDSKLEK